MTLKSEPLKGQPHPTAGLWWMAALISLAGGAIAFLISLDKMHTNYRYTMALTLTVTVIAAGLCVISATASWWLKR